MDGYYNRDEKLLPTTQDEAGEKRTANRHCRWEVRFRDVKEPITIYLIGLPIGDAIQSQIKAKLSVTIRWSDGSPTNIDLVAGLVQAVTLRPGAYIVVESTKDSKAESASSVGLRIVLPSSGHCAFDMLNFRGSCYYVTKVPQDIQTSLLNIRGGVQLASFENSSDISQFIAANEAKLKEIPYRQPLSLSQPLRLGMFLKTDKTVMSVMSKRDNGCLPIQLPADFKVSPDSTTGRCATLKVVKSSIPVVEFGNCSSPMLSLLRFPDSAPSVLKLTQCKIQEFTQGLLEPLWSRPTLSRADVLRTWQPSGAHCRWWESRQSETNRFPAAVRSGPRWLVMQLRQPMMLEAVSVRDWDGQWLAAAPVGSPVSAVGASSVPLELQLEDPCDASWEAFNSSSRWRQLGRAYNELNSQAQPAVFELRATSAMHDATLSCFLTDRPAERIEQTIGILFRVTSQQCSVWNVSHSCWLTQVGGGAAARIRLKMSSAQQTGFSSTHWAQLPEGQESRDWLVRCSVNQSGLPYPDVEAKFLTGRKSSANAKRKFVSIFLLAVAVSSIGVGCKLAVRFSRVRTTSSLYSYDESNDDELGSETNCTVSTAASGAFHQNPPASPVLVTVAAIDDVEEDTEPDSLSSSDEECWTEAAGHYELDGSTFVYYR
uniref:Ig-like domain-containing protein n=1 Tax=Macrostomum lignano TaxID=282301 RepID=A0A1I8JHF2_9PLAT